MSNRVGFLLAASIVLLFMAYAAEPDAFERGMAAFRKRDFPAAERELTKLVREHPTSARAWKLLGMVYSSQDKYENAEGPLRRACELNAQEENACYYLGRLYFTVSRLAESLEAFRKAPPNGRVLLGRALTLEAMSRPVDKVRHSCQWPMRCCFRTRTSGARCKTWAVLATLRWCRRHRASPTEG